MIIAALCGGERFKSVIVEKGETIVNCLAYIEINPLRAGWDVFS